MSQPVQLPFGSWALMALRRRPAERAHLTASFARSRASISSPVMIGPASVVRFGEVSTVWRLLPWYVSSILDCSFVNPSDGVFASYAVVMSDVDCR